MSDNIWGPFIGTSTGILTVLGTIYAAINHKKIVAKCCGKKFEFEIHVDEVKKNGNESTSVRVLPEESIQDVNHKKLTSIPIGIANNMWPHGNKDIITNISNNIKESVLLCVLHLS
jgi:uncharacterized protein (DUF111 family)